MTMTAAEIRSATKDFPATTPAYVQLPDKTICPIVGYYDQEGDRLIFTTVLPEDEK